MSTYKQVITVGSREHTVTAYQTDVVVDGICLGSVHRCDLVWSARVSWPVPGDTSQRIEFWALKPTKMEAVVDATTQMLIHIDRFTAPVNTCSTCRDYLPDGDTSGTCTAFNDDLMRASDYCCEWSGRE